MRVALKKATVSVIIVKLKQHANVKTNENTPAETTDNRGLPDSVTFESRTCAAGFYELNWTNRKLAEVRKRAVSLF